MTTMCARQTHATLHLDVFILLVQLVRAMTTILVHQIRAIPPLDAFTL